MDQPKQAVLDIAASRNAPGTQGNLELHQSRAIVSIPHQPAGNALLAAAQPHPTPHQSQPTTQASSTSQGFHHPSSQLSPIHRANLYPDKPNYSTSARPSHNQGVPLNSISPSQNALASPYVSIQQPEYGSSSHNSNVAASAQLPYHGQSNNQPARPHMQPGHPSQRPPGNYSAFSSGAQMPPTTSLAADHSEQHERRVSPPPAAQRPLPAAVQPLTTGAAQVATPGLAKAPKGSTSRQQRKTPRGPKVLSGQSRVDFHAKVIALLSKSIRCAVGPCKFNPGDIEVSSWRDHVREVHFYRQEAAVPPELINQVARESCFHPDCSCKAANIPLPLHKLLDHVNKVHKVDLPPQK